MSRADLSDSDIVFGGLMNVSRTQRSILRLQKKAESLHNGKLFHHSWDVYTRNSVETSGTVNGIVSSSMWVGTFQGHDLTLPGTLSSALFCFLLHYSLETTS